MTCHFKCTSSLSDALGRAYDSKNGTDLVLATKDGLQIEAHQCVLAYSPFLLQMFEIPEVRYLPKAQIIFPDFGIKSLRTLLRFLYTGEILLEKGSSTLLEFQNLCDLLRIDPAVSKQRSSPSASAADSDRFSCEYCKNRYNSRDLLKSHVNREHRNKSSSEKDKKRRDEKDKDEKRRQSEKDRQKDKDSKKDKDKSRHKSSDKSSKRVETESDRGRSASTSKDDRRKDKSDSIDASKKSGTSSEKEKKQPNVAVGPDEIVGDEPMTAVENSSTVIEKDLAEKKIIEDRIAIVAPLGSEASVKPLENPAIPVQATINPVESSFQQVDTPVTHVETATKPDEISINAIEAQVKPIEAQFKPGEAQSKPVNNLSKANLTEHKSIEESQAALLEEAEEIAKFIQQSAAVPASSTAEEEVQPDAETEVELSSVEDEPKECIGEPEIDAEAETDVDIPDEEDIELGEEDEPVVGNNDNVDMFGFKMPDNFDLPDDFYSDIRSSEKPNAEPSQTTIEETPVVSSHIIADENPHNLSVDPHFGVDPHIDEESLIIEEPLPSTSSPETVPEGEYTTASGHKMPKLTFQKADEPGPSLSLTNVKIMSLKENLENTRRRLASKFKREEIEKFDEQKDVRRSKKSSKVRRENIADTTMTSKRPRGKRPKTTGVDDDFIVESDVSETDDESNSSFIEKDVSSSFENDKEWDPVKEDGEAQENEKESRKKEGTSSPKKRAPQKKHRREERKKRREDRKKKYESERGSTSDEEDLEEEVVKVWAKRGAKSSAVPAASRPRLKVSVQMEAEHNVMELMNYKLRVQHAATTSEEEDISSKKVKPEKKIATKDVKDKKGDVNEKKLKRISRLLSSSSSEHEEAAERKDKESGEADTTDGEEEESETSKQKAKKTKNNEDDEEEDEEGKQKNRKKRRNSTDESSGERNRRKKKSKKRSSSSESNSNSDSSREPSQSPKKYGSKSDPRQFKRSLSLDASKYGKRPSAFSRQFSSNVGRPRHNPSQQTASFPYNYGLSSENKLLAEKRAKEPDELSKIMKMSFKKKIPSSEAEQKSETESATIPKTSPNSEVRPTTVSAKLTSGPETSRSQVSASNMKISPGWATLAARPAMFETARGSVVLPDRPGPRTTPGIGQPKDVTGFSRPFPPNRGATTTAFPPISPYQMQLPPPHKRMSPTRSGSVDPRTMAVPPQQFGFVQPPQTRYPMFAPRPAESGFQQQQPVASRFGHPMGPGVSAPQNNRQ